jgi:predicted permease
VIGLSDLLYSARGFARTPGLTFALLLTIALGIGSNAAVHGFVRGLLVRDFPVAAVERVVSVFARDTQHAAGPMSYGDYLALKQRKDTFEWLGAVRESQGTIVRDDESTIVSLAAVTREIAVLFDLPVDEGVVISHRMWSTAFGGKPDIDGKPIRLDGVDGHVSGVAPEWLDGMYDGRPVDAWVPLREESLLEADRRSQMLWLVGRLRPAVSVDRAQTSLDASGIRSGDTVVAPYTGMTPEVSGGLTRVGTLLSLGAGVVFFVACANVASFLLGRAYARSHEASIRVALGARRAQLARQLLSDSVLISAAGGAAGVLLAVWTSNVVPALFFEQDAERLVFAPAVSSIVAAAAACFGITIACGLMPLVEIRDDRPASVLRRESAGPSTTMRRVRAALVVAQMACCSVLLISAGVLVQGLRTALQTSVAHRVGQPILATVQTSPDLGLRYFQDVERTAQSIGDVTSTAWTAPLPASRPVWQAFRVEPAGLPRRDVALEIVEFTPESLADVVLPPIAGRMFGARDTAHSCRVAVLNEVAADMLFDSQTVGRSLEARSGHPVEIVGVVRVKNETARSREPPTLYYYTTQKGVPFDGVSPAGFRVSTGEELASVVLDSHVVSPSYFDAMSFSTAAGRIFSDVPEPWRCRVAVINQDAAERYFGGQGVGAAIIDSAGRRTEIVGVVQEAPLRTFQRRAEPAIYFSMAEDFIPRMTLILGARQASDALIAEVRRRLEMVPGGAALPVVRTLDAHLRQTALAPLRIATVLVGAFAAIALALGLLGVHGALADAARQQRREIAVRIALGAQGWRVIRQVMGEGGRLAAAGALAGIGGALLVMHLLARIVPIRDAPSTWVWWAGPVVLVGAVAMASVLPAWRASKIDPLTIARDAN